MATCWMRSDGDMQLESPKDYLLSDKAPEPRDELAYRIAEGRLTTGQTALNEGSKR